MKNVDINVIALLKEVKKKMPRKTGEEPKCLLIRELLLK